MTAENFNIERVQAYALSCAVDGGPISSLAPMPTRNGLLLKVTTGDGAIGWGEAWCNYPPRGNVSKLTLIQDVIAPVLFELEVPTWRDLRAQLETSFSRMLIHTGEPGPFKHCIAALDMAIADIAARRKSIPLSALLSAWTDMSSKRVGVYCSTPDVDRMESVIPDFESRGHACFKLKVGFDDQRDFAILEKFKATASSQTLLCMDANQNWTTSHAKHFAKSVEAFDPLFIEEPLRADASAADWIELAKHTNIAFAAGENITTEDKFREHIDNKSLAIVQPDVAKWGGVSGAVEVGRYARSQGSSCCLHYMGTALGQAASLHCMAAIGGDGRVELDANPNPLRTDLGELNLQLENGTLAVPTSPGIGFAPDEAALKRFTVAECDLTT